MVAAIDQMSQRFSGHLNFPELREFSRKTKPAIRRILLGKETPKDIEHLQNVRMDLTARILKKLDMASSAEKIVKDADNEGFDLSACFRHALSANPLRVGHKVRQLARVHNALDGLRGHGPAQDRVPQAICEASLHPEVTEAVRTRRERSPQAASSATL